MKNIKQKLIFLLKIIFSFIILYYLFSKVGIKPVIDTAIKIPMHFFVLVVLIHFVIMYLSALRTRLILRFKIKISRLLSISAITYFFNTFTPANMGGDIIKLYFIKKEIKNNFSNGLITDAFAPIFMERFMGLFVTLFLCVIFLPNFLNYYKIQQIWAFPTIMTIFFILTLAILHFQVGNKIKLIADFYKSLSHFKSRKNFLYISLIYSIIIQMLNIFIVYILSIGLGLNIHYLYYFSIIPLITLINLIPISIGGLGIREGAFVFFLNIVHIPADKALALSLLNFATTFTASLIGLIEYLRYKDALKDNLKNKLNIKIS